MDNIINNDFRNILIASHSKRIRSFIYKNFVNFKKKLRFRNCAILKIYYDTSNNKTLIELLYNGDTDKNENRKKSSYYTMESFNQLNIYSNTLIVPNNINIFLIRHAQGYHNANNTMFKKFIASFDNKILRDPQLTDIGINQANNAGKYLDDYFNINKLNKKLCLIFCSVLLRTRETINIILNNMKIYDKDIIILPCSSEISSFDEKEIIGFDNHMCKNDDKQRIIYKCDFIKDNQNKMRNIDWTYFNEFKKKFIENNNDNKNINMIYQTYDISRKLIKKINEIA